MLRFKRYVKVKFGVKAMDKVKVKPVSRSWMIPKNCIKQMQCEFHDKIKSD